MNSIRHIIPVSVLLLIILNIYSVALTPYISSNQAALDQSTLTRTNLDSTSENFLSQQRVSNEISFNNITLTTDKDIYAPGEWLAVTADGTSDEMNGTFEWKVESPIGESAFDFYSGFKDIFQDRTFDNSSVKDWKNASFDFVETPLDYLNMTEINDTDMDDAEIYFDGVALEDGWYRISFDYKSMTQNLLANASFENGYTGGWQFNSSHVTPINDPKNASKGSYYMRINGTTGYKLSQNVSISGVHSITFSARATGVTSDNYWYLSLEAYNSTNHRLGSVTNSQDSIGASVNDKGYAYRAIENWDTPTNTSYIRAIFYGQDLGGDGNYTGWLDDCYLGEVAPELRFSYSDGTLWQNRTIDAGNHEWESTTFDIELKRNTSKTFRLILPDSNSFSNNVTSYWFIDNIAVNNITVSSEIMQAFFNKVDFYSGTVNSTWFHQGYRENLTSSIDINYEKPVGLISNGHVSIKIQLPFHQLYFGSWIFMFVMHPVDTGGSYLGTSQTINISFVVDDSMNFIIQDIYLLRGSTNQSQIFTEYFEQETNIEAISPGDNVTLLGYLEANSSQGDPYDLEYLLEGKLQTFLVQYTWKNNWTSQENITWEGLGAIPFDSEGDSIIDGNFTHPYNKSQTIGINFVVPERGIYGNLSAILEIILVGTNVKDGGVGGDPLSIITSLDLPPVKFKIEVIEKNLPKTSYYLSEDLEGSITIDFKNYNDTLEDSFPSRNISSNLTIPMSDLEFAIFLDDIDHTPLSIDISQNIHFQFIGKRILWLDRVDPHLLTGTYRFRIRWNTPYDLGVFDQEELNVTHSLEVKGVLDIFFPYAKPVIKQGEMKTINFTVRTIELNESIRGLNLIANISSNQSLGQLVVYEENGIYKIDLDVALDFKANNYTIEISALGRTDIIGEITFQVTEREITEKTTTPTLIDLFFDVGGFAIFVIIGAVLVGAMFLVNKSIK